MKLSPIALLFLAGTAFAGSATWNLSPATGNWNTASNWTPATIPNSPTDTATFAVSNTTAVSISAGVEVNGVVYNAAASAFTITLNASQILTISGVGITNNSGVTQTFSVGKNPAEIHFTNNASAGTQTSFSTTGGASNLGFGGEVLFSNNSIVVDSAFVNNGGTVSGAHGGITQFNDTTSAGNAVITNNERGISTAAGGGKTLFTTSATAGNATITNMPDGEPLLTTSGGATEFVDGASAGTSTITNEGATVSGQIGGATNFQDTADAGTATIICNGGQVAGAHGGIVRFVESAKSGNATLIANGGLNGGDGGQIQIVGRPPQVASPRVEVFDNGELVTGTATIGSLEGTGIVDLGGTLSVGSSNLSTTFSGTLQDFGSLTKIGTGTLQITGNNTYTGSTIASGGNLFFSSTATLTTQFVEVDAGTLGGGVTIPSQVNVGGMGSPAFLAPAAGGRKQATMTIQGELLMLEEGTYKCTFKARGSQVLSDQVKANAVVLFNSTPTIAFKATIQGTLTPGTTFTILSNTSANPIDGTFSNLPDSAIVTISGTNFQANYEGGDGNDLTLTVVP